MKTIPCNCQDCLSNTYNQEDYYVDTSINKKLKAGVSGMLRVKDESEFLAPCIESCINALDELIIVVQKSSDNSLEIALNYQKQHPNKIQVYSYPTVDAYTIYERNSLSDSEINNLIKRINTIHGSANYYNFAQSKCNFKYVFKIDADQIYAADKLNFIIYTYKKSYLSLAKILLCNIFNIIKIKAFLKLYMIIFKNKNKNNFALCFHGINLHKYNNTIYALNRSFATDIPIINYQKLTKLPFLIFNGGKDYFIYENNNVRCAFNPSALNEYLTTKNNHPIHYVNGGVLFFHMQGVKQNYVERLKKLNMNFESIYQNNQENFVQISNLLNLKAIEKEKIMPESFNYNIDWVFNTINKLWSYDKRFLKNTYKKYKNYFN